MLKSTVKAVLINKDGTETPVQIVFSDMDVSSELATSLMDGMLERLPEFKTYTDGEVKISDVEEFPFARDKKDEQTIFDADNPPAPDADKPGRKGKGKKKLEMAEDDAHGNAAADPED
jgi:hypothetical protein